MCFERLVVSVVGSYLEIDVLQGLNTFNTVYAEALAQKCSVKKLFLKSLQNSLENTFYKQLI